MAKEDVVYEASISKEMEHDRPGATCHTESEHSALSKTKDFANEEKPEETPPSGGFGCCCRCLESIPVKYPRTFSVVFHIIIPLWFLIVIALGCGVFLAQYEAPLELDTNDIIVANRFIIENFDLDVTLDKILNLPLQCFEEYLDASESGSTNFTLLDLANNYRGNDDVVGVDATSGQLLDYFGQELAEFRDHMADCSKEAQELVNVVLDFWNQTSLATATQRLTFNWIRCWNETELGPVRTFSPSPLQVKAAANQSSFYESSWKEDQGRLFREYLEDDYISSLEAFNRSVAEATGSDYCEENIGATAWFWFTVMTTVGMY
jgi:hypothetical protein